VTLLKQDVDIERKSEYLGVAVDRGVKQKEASAWRGEATKTEKTRYKKTENEGDAELQ